MHKSFGPEFLISMLVATFGYIFGLGFLKNYINPVIYSLMGSGDISMLHGTCLVYGLFILNTIGFMATAKSTHDLLSYNRNDDKIMSKI